MKYLWQIKYKCLCMNADRKFTSMLLNILPCGVINICPCHHKKSFLCKLFKNEGG